MNGSAAPRGGQTEFWENVAERRPPTHPAVLAFAAPKAELIARVTSLPREARLLEIGCGNGFLTHCLSARWNVVALDRSRRMLTLNPHAQRAQGEAERLPFRDGACDIALCANLLHHMEEPVAAVREMTRVSRKFVALIEPNRDNPLMWLFSALKKVENGALKFSLRYLVSLLEQAGLRPLYASGQGSVVPNKTPRLLLPLLQPFNGEGRLGFYNLAIGEKIKP